MYNDPFNNCLRQVHLDFHNSPFIDDLLSDFDPSALARQFKEAHINSVIVFAKCVHGMGYYPSKVVQAHPALKGRDFTGEMIEALHKEGIRAPIYTIIGWEENLAQRHPEWMQICADGSFAQNANGSDGSNAQPGRFRWLNFLHPDYQDYFAAHLEEVLNRYPCDGLFLDMLVVHPQADWSDHAIEFRANHGLMGKDALTHARFEALAQKSFAGKFTPLIQAKAPHASIFYNAENRMFVDGSLGALARADQQTHFEIESLPSGFWSYQHFPRVARNVRTRKAWLGMTGRFQKIWGDFGGIKAVPALEYECYRSQALGGANSVGDQLGPRGNLDAGAYRLIGDVFASCASAETFYRDCHPCPTVAIVCPHHPSRPEHATTLVEEAMVRLCDEHHYDAAIVNDVDDLSAFSMLILGEGTVTTPALRTRISEFMAAGGKVLAAGDSIFDCDVVGWGPFQSIRLLGDAVFAPAYWRAQEAWTHSLGTDERVIYNRGLQIQASGDFTVPLQRIAPYFQRTDLRFCSHFQAPPRKQITGEPAALQSSNYIYFADPIFTEYRQSANWTVSQAFATAMQRLIGKPTTGWGVKSTVRICPLRKEKDLHLTLLHYIPERKADGADIISERLGFAGMHLSLPEGITSVIQEPEGVHHPVINGRFALPAVDGRLLLRIPAFFSTLSQARI